jgi:hypothetical protein
MKTILQAVNKCMKETGLMSNNIKSSKQILYKKKGIWPLLHHHK